MFIYNSCKKPNLFHVLRGVKNKICFVCQFKEKRLFYGTLMIYLQNIFLFEFGCWPLVLKNTLKHTFKIWSVSVHHLVFHLS